MKLVIPPYLKRGDKVAIVATARWISPEDYEVAKNLVESWGFVVCAGKNLFTQRFQLAGTDAERASDMQAAIDDPEIKAIIIARGGYGTIRMLDLIDFRPLLTSPKWICGYSDITVLLMKLTSMGIASIHSTMPISFGDATSLALDNLHMALKGELRQIEFANPVPNEHDQQTVSGVFLGGNLSVIYSLLGSRELLTDRDFILFIEDVDEMYYHIDRMLFGLYRSGFFNHAKAFCIGGFTQMKDNTPEFGFSSDNPWGRTSFESIADMAEKLVIPVFSGFPAGHMSDNRAFYCGVPAQIECEKGIQRLNFQHTHWDK